MARPFTSLTPLQRIALNTNYDGRVVSSELGPCHEWTGTLSPKGYGVIRVGGRRGRNLLVHRISYLEQIGEIPDDTPCVLHRCDNPPCWRKEHLFLGTKSTNSSDMVAKQRHARGERAAAAKLTNEDILAIRKRYATGSVTQARLAEEYGVRTLQIHRIVKRLYWRHI
jgi:hypothetical protein